MYTPNSTFHKEIDGIAKGDPLNSTNLNKAANNVADNALYTLTKLAGLLRDNLGIFFKVILRNGVISISGGQVHIASGSLMIGEQLLNFSAQDLGLQVNTDYIVYARLSNYDLFTSALSVHYAASLPTDDITTKYYKLADVSSSGIITDSVKRFTDSELSGLMTALHFPNTDTHTDKKEFYVGGGPNSPGAAKVLTMKNQASRVQNLRIISVSSERAKYTDNSMKKKLSTFVKSNSVRGLLVNLSWNYDYIEGIGGLGTFTINLPTLSVAQEI